MTEQERKTTALEGYRKKLLEHREVESKVKSCTYRSGKSHCLLFLQHSKGNNQAIKARL